MKKLTYSQLIDVFYKHNETKQQPITAVIVYDKSNWKEPFTETERSYRISSDNNLFYADKISTSVYGNCLDGKDLGVRLDWYNWKVEYCYLDD